MVTGLSRTVLATAGLSALAMSCQLLLGIKDEDFEVADGGGGSAEASIEAGACGRQPPTATAGDGDGDGDGGTYIFAIKTITLGGGSTRGFDLDRACTCIADDPNQRAASCTPPNNALVRDGCDEDAGVDNAINQLREVASGGLDEQINIGLKKDFDCGRRTLLLLLQRYNGLANDDDVTVTALPSFGIRGPQNNQADAAVCYPHYPALWDGTDVWSVSNARLSPDQQPFTNAVKAYVVDFKLVVDTRRVGQGANVTIPMPGFGKPPVEIATPVLVGQLVKQDAAFNITDGLLTGRVSTNVAVASLARTDIAITADIAAPACTLGEAWNNLKKDLCRASDLAIDPKDDFTNKPCDALSFVVGFTAVPAQAKSATEDDAGPLPSCAPATIACP